MSNRIEFQNQLQVAHVNLQVAEQEMARIKTLVSIATEVAFLADDTTGLQCALANSVQKAALEAVLSTLKPPMQVVQEPETDNVVAFPEQGC